MDGSTPHDDDVDVHDVQHLDANFMLQNASKVLPDTFYTNESTFSSITMLANAFIAVYKSTQNFIDADRSWGDL
jgi:hypothetical protein